VHRQTDQRQQQDAFLGTIDGSNTMLVLAGADGQIKGRDPTLLLLAGRWFG
jgi:hypothetical protein